MTMRRNHLVMMHQVKKIINFEVSITSMILNFIIFFGRYALIFPQTHQHQSIKVFIVLANQTQKPHDHIIIAKI